MTTDVDASVHDASADAAVSEPVAQPPADHDGRVLDLDRREVRTSLLAIALAAVIAVPVLWNYSWRPMRAALPSTLFSNFFDLQARAFFEGRVDVARNSLGNEGFVIDGQEHMYYGPFPALLRMPVLSVTRHWDGRLSALSMLVGWLAFGTAVAMLAWRLRRAMGGHDGPTRSERRWWGGFIVAVTGGSPMLLLLAEPWVYNEAILWGTAGSVGVLAAAAGVLERPTGDRLWALFAWTCVAALSRVTAAWPAALLAVLVALTNHRRKPSGGVAHHVPAAVAAGLVPLALALGLNVARFDHPFALPVEHQVWTEISAQRRQVLDEGGLVGLRFVPTTAVAYARPDGLRFSPVFPFVQPPEQLPVELGGAELDMRYRTPSVPATMPAGVLFGMIGLIALVRCRRPEATGLASMVATSAMIPGGVLLIGYVAPRYLAEFIPVITVTSAIGLSAVLAAPRRRRRLALAAGVVLAAFGLVVNLAMASWAASAREGGSALRRYLDVGLVAARVLPGAEPPSVTVGTDPPRQSSPDEIFVVGGCLAAYLGTGDRYEPWTPLWDPDLTVGLAAGERDDDPQPDSVTLVEFGSTDVRVVVETDGRSRFRLRVEGIDTGFADGPWTSIEEVDGLAVTVARPPVSPDYIVEAPGHLYAAVPAVERWGDEFRAVPGPARVPDGVVSQLRRVGMDASVSTRFPALCDDLLELAR